VALGDATVDGCVLFAKNSDRPAGECQPLTLAPAARHAAGSRLRCTYIEIPQVAATARVLGSRPYWCWGFEHGVNEHGVAIGNHTVFTKDPVLGVGLIGMDLVRLGLERGRSARDAVSVITSLLVEHGQGGSGYADKDWPYHNSFLIADRSEAFVLETSDRRWALRRVTDVAAVSNHLSIGRDWEEMSPDTVAHARAQGWWNVDAAERFDFAAAYRDTSMAPEVISIGRHARNCQLLRGHDAPLTLAVLRHGLRDHAGSVVPRLDLAPDNPDYFSVCMHADPVGTTTASLITRIGPDTEPLLYWAGLGSPCTGIFLPLFLDCDPPVPLQRGGATPEAGMPGDSAWWQFHELGRRVALNWQENLPRVRARLDAFEADANLRMQHDEILAANASTRATFQSETVSRALQLVGELIASIP